MAIFLKDHGAAEMKPIAEGWIDENGEYLGRPVDVAQLRDVACLQSRLRGFRSGRREREITSAVAQTLGDEEIDDLLAWRASLHVVVTAPG